jgi:hypothetical protein
VINFFEHAAGQWVILCLSGWLTGSFPVRVHRLKTCATNGVENLCH